MATPTRFLIAGGTGRQGGAVVNALFEDPSTPVTPGSIYVITRTPSNPTAVRLEGKGIQLIQGDLSASSAIFEQLSANADKSTKSPLAVFLAQAHGPTEVTDAKAFIDAAVVAQVAHFVYSSVDRGGKIASDRDGSYCKTFSDKFAIEKHLIAAAEASNAIAGTKSHMNYTILRPTWFAENAEWGFPGKLCMTAWRDVMDGKRLQVVVAKDLGRWAVEAMLRPDAAGIRNEALSVTSDELTFDQVDDIYRQVTGRGVAVTYGWSTRLMAWLVADLRTMFAWIKERDYGADLEFLGKHVKPTTFRSWLESVETKRC